MTDFSDLMFAYCAGDASAFRALHANVAPRLFRYLVKMCRDRELAADLVQQTFLKLHRARHGYIAGADPLPWIFSIAYRLFVDHVRRRQASVVDMAAGTLPEPSVEPPATEPDRQRLAAAMAELEKLPEIQRQAVILIKLEGRSVDEAAAIAGTTSGAMRIRAHRGYEALRAALRDQEMS